MSSSMHNIKKRNFTLSSALISTLLLTHIPHGLADDALIEQKIEHLEKEIVTLKSDVAKNNRKQKSIQTAFDEFKERLKINGFMSAGLAQSNRDRLYDGVGNDLTTLNLGKMGLQTNFRINSDTEAVVQMLGRARNNDWDLGAQWAYVSHLISSNFNIKVGRMRLRTFNRSADIDVSYAYPWVEPPNHAYYMLPFQNYDGIELEYLFESADWTYKMALYSGENHVTPGGSDLNNKDMIGYDFTASGEDLSLRLGVGRAHAEFAWDKYGIDIKPDAWFSSLGFNYDTGNWFITGEFTRRDVADPLVSDVNGGYLSAGKRFEHYLPYITVSRAKTTDNDERDGLLAEVFNVQETGYMLGVRRDLITGVAVKFQVEYLTNFGGSNGRFDTEFTSPHIDFDNATLWSLALDAVF